MNGPILETERLILRPPMAEDLGPWADFAADLETARFLGGVRTRAEVWRALTTMAGAWSLYGFAMFCVLEKSTGRWIGRLGPWMPEAWPGPEIGWGLARDAWGKGYATEGSAAAADWAFDHLGWSEMIHTIDPDNAASIAVARRLGSTRLGEGRLPPPFDQPIDIYGQTRDQWRARRA